MVDLLHSASFNWSEDFCLVYKFWTFWILFNHLSFLSMPKSSKHWGNVLLEQPFLVVCAWNCIGLRSKNPTLELQLLYPFGRLIYLVIF